MSMPDDLGFDAPAAMAPLAPFDASTPPDERRARLRDWLAAHPDPSGADLADAGLVAPQWPTPWGLGADAQTQLLIDEELAEAGVVRPSNPIGIGWAGPTLLAAGTDAQRARWLPSLLAGEAIWCQLFSEPDAGSDLASLTTSARRDGDEWVISGQKIWTSYAHVATWGILLARTANVGAPQRGISYFVCPMTAPGVTVRPLVDMTGLHTFNQVFLDEVRIPADHLIGDENDGWRLAKVTLGNERVSLSAEGALWGRGPTAAQLVALVAERAIAHDALVRDELVQCWIRGEILRLLRQRLVQSAVAGREPGPEASVRKALADDHGQVVMQLAHRLAGTAGMLAGRGPGQVGGDEGSLWYFGLLFSPALTIGGGTSSVQRTIIAERVLGLPKEPPVAR